MTDLNDLYLQAINAQRNHLSELQERFNKRCNEISVQTGAKLKNIDPNDSETKQKILLEEKKLFDQALWELKNATNQSQLETRHRLEEIQSQRERETLDKLEGQITEL